jgi:hypothetical protein
LASKKFALLAQLVEQLPLKQTVVGSNPTRRTDPPLARRHFLTLIKKWERGRENGSFPAVEILKPQGFKEERSDDAPIAQWIEQQPSKLTM